MCSLCPYNYWLYFYRKKTLLKICKCYFVGFRKSCNLRKWLFQNILQYFSKAKYWSFDCAFFHLTVSVTFTAFAIWWTCLLLSWEFCIQNVPHWDLSCITPLGFKMQNNLLYKSYLDFYAVAFKHILLHSIIYFWL